MNAEMELFGLNRSDLVIKYSKLNPIIAYEDESIEEIINKILVAQQRVIPLISNKKSITGIITLMDILNSFLRQQNFHDPVSTIMNREIIYCEAYDNLDSLIKKFNISKRGTFPVLENKRVIGIVGEREIIRAIKSSTIGIKVSEIMTRKPFYTNIKNNVKEILKSIVNTKYRRLPVMSGNKLIGMITAYDILKYLKNHNFSEDSLSENVERVMIKNLITIPPSADIFTAIEMFRKNNISGMPVIGKNLEGIITEKDIIKIIN